MKKDGFVLVETIIVVVVLVSSLLLLYSTFNKILQNEKTRVNYDDINYIYRTWYIKNTLESLNITMAKKDLNLREINDRSIYFITLGVEYKGLFDGYEDKESYFSNILSDYNVNQIVLLNTNKIDNLKKCNLSCSNDKNCNDYGNCNEIYTNLSEDMVNYLKTLNVELSAPYTLVVEFNECDVNNVCSNYYGWVGV